MRPPLPSLVHQVHLPIEYRVGRRYYTHLDTRIKLLLAFSAGDAFPSSSTGTLISEANAASISFEASSASSAFIPSVRRRLG